MSLEANKTLARRHFEELWMKGDLDAYGDPTGRHVSVDGAHIHRIRDGKIVEVWAHGDYATFMRHVGLIPVE